MIVVHLCLRQGPIAIGCALAMLPVGAFAVLVRSWLVRGLTDGAVKE
jgi:ABC-type glycerol-3-phosphate transport system permease component